jgi:hypothetical protein
MDVQSRVNDETLHDSENKVKYIHFDADTTSYKMKQGDRCVIATSENADGSGILYLPSKAEAAGKSYYICAPTGATGGDISVYDKEAGTEIATYGDLNADDDHVIFYCDGRLWRMIFDGVA